MVLRESDLIELMLSSSGDWSPSHDVILVDDTHREKLKIQYKNLLKQNLDYFWSTCLDNHLNQLKFN